MSKKIKIGSSVFFGDIDGYQPKDMDEMILLDEWLPKNHNVLNFRKGKKDVFLWSPLTKEEFIEDTLSCGVPMRVGKFLVPEFCEHIGFTVNELKIFDDLFKNLDDKHKYEELIYNSYINNKAFYLTEEQKYKCYEMYKKYRD